MKLETVNDYIDAKLTHSVHTSERRSFRGCRRRWSWIFRDYYYPLTTAKPLEFGVAFHKAMEVYYDPKTWGNFKVAAALALVAFRNVVEEQRAAFKETVEELSPEQETDYNERVELGLGMLKHYFEKEAPRYDNDFTPVKVEIKFEVPIQDKQGNSLWCKCIPCYQRHIALLKTQRPMTENEVRLEMASWKGLPVTYGGRLDMLAKDTWGRYWIFDWKTAAQLTSNGEDDYLLLDDQITSYCWALSTILGIDIAGFVYAEFKKSAPEEPEPNKHVRLGRRFSVSKQKVYDPELYRRTVAELDTEAYEDGLYDEFIAYLNTDANAFHRRHNVPRSAVELENAGQSIFDEAADMVDPNLRVYPSPGRFSCRFCAFQEPCLNKNKGEDYKYQLDTMFDKRRYHYWETAEASTDGKGGE